MKKNPDFFFLQYNKINWKNQEKTKINSFINEYIIKNVISKHGGESISVFDIGFGIGFFIQMLASALKGKYQEITIEGCEPSRVNFEHLEQQGVEGVNLAVYPTGFLETQTNTQFDFMTAIYVFPHFLFEDLEKVVQKIHVMLKSGGRFVLVLANEKYLQGKLDSERDLFIESGEVTHNGKTYKEVLHYTDIPEIGKVIDYNREEAFYFDLFSSNGFTVESKEDLDDNGFVCSLFVFHKQ